MSARPDPIRVASVPAGHPYVQSVAPGPSGARLLPDPELGRPPGQWWPPALFDPEYLRANLDGFDLLHVHFGLESVPTAQLVAALRTLREGGRPLVFTVHDLENPQLTDQTLHREQLAAVIAAADELITLTPGAAAAIEAEWGRTATVIPHPRIAAHYPRAGGADTGRAARIGVHLRDLRPNIAATTAVRELIEAVDELAGDGMPVVGIVRLDDRVRDPALAAAIEHALAGADHVRLERGPRQGDHELEQWITDLDVAVLPYSHGTHSGWAELCWDLGVVVVDDGTGFVSEQLPDGVVARAPGETGLAGALRRSLAVATAPDSAGRRALVQRRSAYRDRQREQIVRAHAEIYDRVLRSVRA